MCPVNSVFSKYLDKFVLVFLDEILVYSRNEEEHEEHLRMVLQVIREHQLYENLSKWELYQRKVQHLCHVISEEGIEVDMENIEESFNELYIVSCKTHTISNICNIT